MGGRASAMRLTIDQTGITPCKLLSFDGISVWPIFACVYRVSRVVPDCIISLYLEL